MAEALRKTAGPRDELGVVGIEHQQALRDEHAGDGELDVCQACEIVYSVLAEVIGADIGDDRRQGARHGQAHGAECRRGRSR